MTNEMVLAQILLNISLAFVFTFVVYSIASKRAAKRAEKETEERLHKHYRGVRGFERPHPRPTAGSARVHEADYRNKSEGFDA